MSLIADQVRAHRLATTVSLPTAPAPHTYHLLPRLGHGIARCPWQDLRCAPRREQWHPLWHSDREMSGPDRGVNGAAIEHDTGERHPKRKHTAETGDECTA